MKSRSGDGPTGTVEDVVTSNLIETNAILKMVNKKFVSSKIRLSANMKFPFKIFKDFQIVSGGFHNYFLVQ